MKESEMKQCTLRNGDKTQMVWIPLKFAKKGKYLKIKTENGWLVERVHSGVKLTTLNERSQDYRYTRKYSDV